MDDRFETACRICAALKKKGHRALLAGGCVRDGILGVEPNDYDIATSARPGEVAALFERTIGVGAPFGVQTVVMSGQHFEVATFRKDGPYLDGRHPSTVEFQDERADAHRRDFTINALFLDPATGEIIDYVGGRDDLERKVVRTVGDPAERFKEDHLRLLRAVRFAARFGYALDPATQSALSGLAPLIQNTSPERIRDELLKLLTEGQPKRAFELLDETGLLAEILPEASRMKGVEQPPEFHPEGDVFIHTLIMLDLLESPSATLALAVLLHDVGKPLTQTFEDRIRFNHHDKVGARESEGICRRLRLSNAQTARVTWLVEQHMRVATAPDMRESKLKRLVREQGFSDLIELFRVDCLSSHKKLEIYEWLRQYAAEAEPEEIHPPRLVNGRDLIEWGYTPGPLFAEILAAVEDERLEGRIASRNEALQWIQSRWPGR